MEEKTLKEILSAFNLDGELYSYSIVTNGNINSTIHVMVKNDETIGDFIIQKINHFVFKKPFEVMENISNVTNHIKNEMKKSNVDTERKVLNFYPTKNGEYCYKDSNGNYWRICEFVNDTITFNTTEDLKVLEETGKAFGTFQKYLDKFPAEKLNITIPHFHNTVNRYELFDKSVSDNIANRVNLVQKEIQEYNELKELATKMYKMQKEGKLKLRVTHNDTKCNNVLFDKDTKNYLCVIDLDTVMPGLVGFDFGDAIRFGASTAKEDEIDLEKVKIDLKKFEAFTKGFVSTFSDLLTQNEKQTLALGSITMTIECGLRFLTDYLNGDTYFKTNYPEHNIDRARCQLKLAKDMINHYDEMIEIVNKF